MEIENYVMENIISKVVRYDSGNHQYVREVDLDKLRLNYVEKNFIKEILGRKKIRFVEKPMNSAARSSLERNLKRFEQERKNNQRFKR